MPDNPLLDQAAKVAGDILAVAKPLVPDGGDVFVVLFVPAIGGVGRRVVGLAGTVPLRDVATALREAAANLYEAPKPPAPSCPPSSGTTTRGG